MKFFIVLVISLALFGFSNAYSYTPIQWDPENEQLVDILNYGVNKAVSDAIAEEKIADGQWNWINVIRVEVEMIDDECGSNFEFIVEIENDIGDTANLAVIVFLSSDETNEKLANYAIFSM